MTDFFIYSALDSNLVLDVKHDVGQPGTHLQVFDKNYGMNQLWTLVASGGYTKIKSRLEDSTTSSADLVVDIKGGTAATRAAIEVNRGSSAGSQLWTFAGIPGPAEAIKSSLDANMVLDIKGGADKSGAAVQLYRYHGGNNQVWFMSPLYKARFPNTDAGQIVANGDPILGTNNSFSVTSGGRLDWTSIQLTIVNPEGGVEPSFAGNYQGPGTATYSNANSVLDISGLLVASGEVLNFSVDIVAGEGGWYMTGTAKAPTRIR